MDEFTVRIELYKGGHTHKKKFFCFSPAHPPSHDLLAPQRLYPNRRNV